MPRMKNDVIVQTVAVQRIHPSQEKLPHELSAKNLSSQHRQLPGLCAQHENFEQVGTTFGKFVMSANTLSSIVTRIGQLTS